MIIDLSGLPAPLRSAVAKAFQDEFDVNLMRAIREQRIAAASVRLNPPVFRDGIGHQTHTVHPLFDWVARQKYGEDANTPEFWKWLAKRDDSVRVQARPAKVMIGWKPDSASAIAIKSRGACRETRKYAWK